MRNSLESRSSLKPEAWCHQVKGTHSAQEVGQEGHEFPCNGGTPLNPATQSVLIGRMWKRQASGNG